MESEAGREIQDCISRVRHRWRVVRTGEECAVALSVLLAFLLLGLAVDALEPVLPWAGGILSLSFLVAMGLRAVPLGRAVFGTMPQRTILSRIERCYQQLNTNLINAVEIPQEVQAHGNRGNASTALIEVLVSLTGRQVAEVEGRRVVSADGLRRWGRIDALLLVTVLMVLVADASSLGRSASHLLHPFRFVPAAGVRITVRPEGGTVPRGAPVAITANVSGRILPTATLRIWSSGQEGVGYPMELHGEGTFVHRIAQVQAAFDYVVEAGGRASKRYHMAVLDSPEIGNVALEFRYPAYTGLPPRTQHGSGHISAYKGTEVTFRAESSKALAEASIVVAGRRVPLKIEGGLSLSGTLVVLEPGEYWVEAEDEEGLSNPDPVRYLITLSPDEVPAVEIVKPGRDVTSEEGETLDLRFMAKDDFGVSRVFLVHTRGSNPEEEVRALIRRADPPKAFLRGGYPWDLSGLGLLPGAVVTYWIEAEDNDTISGPNVGKSPARTVRIRSVDEEHRRLEAGMGEVRDGFVDLLGDQLEVVIDAEAPLRDAARGEGPSREAVERIETRSQQVGGAASSLLAKVDDLLRGLADDPLTDSSVYLDVSTLRARLEYVRGVLLPRAQEEFSRWVGGGAQEQERLAASYSEAQEAVTAELEQVALLADAIEKSQRMGDVWGLSRRLRPMQDDLLRALEEMRHGMDPERLHEVERQLRLLEEMFGQMMDALAQLAGTIPDDHYNTQALRSLDLAQMMAALNMVKERLAEGDVEGALAQAERMMQAMAETLAAIQDLQQRGEAAADALEQAVEQSAGRLERLMEEQGDILAETSSIESKVSDAVRRKLEGVVEQRREIAQQKAWELGDRLGRFLQELHRRHPRSVSSERLYEMNDELANLKRRLADRDLSTLGDFARRMEQQLAEMSSSQREEAADERRLRSARDQVDDVLFDLRRIADEIGSLADRKKALSAQDKEKLDRLSGRQRRAAEETERLQDELGELATLFPVVDRRMLQALEQAAHRMAEAEDRLSSMNAKGAVPAERNALFHLSESERALEQARQQMGKRQLMLGMSAPMMLRAGEDERGRAGASHKDFALPSEEDYQVPSLYREDVLEALREDYPPSFKEAIERYYKNLSQ